MLVGLHLKLCIKNFGKIKINLEILFFSNFTLQFLRTICPRSLDQFHIVTYYIKWVKTSWRGYYVIFYRDKFLISEGTLPHNPFKSIIKISIKTNLNLNFRINLQANRIKFCFLGLLILYCLPNKSCPILHNKLLYKMVQVFLDIQYLCMCL